jgi:hypothetical protein
MLYLLLHVRNGVASVALEPVPVQVLGGQAELNHQIVTELFGFELAPFLKPQSGKTGFIITHDHPCVRTANKSSPISRHLAAPYVPAVDGGRSSPSIQRSPLPRRTKRLADVGVG